MHKNTKAKVKGAWNIIASFSSHSLWTNTEIKKEDFTMGCNRIQWILNTAQQQSSYVISKWALTALPFPKDAPLAHSVPTIVKHFSYLSCINRTFPFQYEMEATVSVRKATLHSTLSGIVWWTAYLTLEPSQQRLNKKKNVVFLRISFCLWGSIFSEHTTQQPTLSICKGKKDAKQVKKSKNFLSYLTDVLRWQKVAIYHNM